MNLYAYAGNNPITYTDPFGLCAPGGDPPETIEVWVTVFCGGDPQNETNYEERLVTARRVTNPREVDRLNEAADRLKGGSTDFPADKVSSAIRSADAVYVFDAMTEDGKLVVTGGEAVGNYLAFRSNDWDFIQRGSGFLNRQVLTNYRGTACGTIGHEGVHLIQHATGALLDTERIALAVRWSCR